MENADELPALLRQAQQSLAAWPASRPVDVLEIARQAAAEAPQWFDGQPARRLLAYLLPMQAAARVAPVDAAGELLAPLIDDGCSRVLVLHPARSAERLADYAKRHAASPGWGLARCHRAADSDTLPAPVLNVDPAALKAKGLRLNLSPATAEAAARGAANELLSYWVPRLKAGHVDGLDRPPGLPPGAVLGVLERDAAELWPALKLRTRKAAMSQHDRAETKARQLAALERAAPPADFTKGRKWSDAHKLAFIAIYDELIAAGMGKEAALLELALKGWADNAATLAKRITAGNEARAQAQGRRGALRRV